MCGEVEYGRCDCCGKDALLQRQYFDYDIKCDCCVGDKHFEMVRHCSNCTPRIKTTIKITLENVTPIGY